MATRAGDVDRAVAVLATRGVPPLRARAALNEMARRRHISLGQCAALVVHRFDRAGS